MKNYFFFYEVTSCLYYTIAVKWYLSVNCFKGIQISLWYWQGSGSRWSSLHASSFRDSESGIFRIRIHNTFRWHYTVDLTIFVFKSSEITLMLELSLLLFCHLLCKNNVVFLLLLYWLPYLQARHILFISH